MAITRLQQARQLYAVGQLVSKTLDGSRPGYRGEGEYQGGTSSSSGKSGNPGGDRPNPHTTSGTSKTSTRGPKSYDGPGNIHSDDPKAPPAYEIIGGKKYDVTPNTRRERELAKMKQTIVQSPLNNPFAPTPKKFNLFTDVIIPVGLTAINPPLAAKYGKVRSAYNVAKNLAGFAETIGSTDKNVVESFTDSLTSNFSDKFSGFGKGKKTTTKSSIDEDLSKIGNGNGGLDSVGNVNALNQEYLLLLNKFNTGAFTDSDRVRFTFLKNMLGK